MLTLIPVDPKTHKVITSLPYGHYWACQTPERPGDQKTHWSHECRACLVHLAAQMHSVPELRDVRMQYVIDDQTGVMATAADGIAYTCADDPILARAAASYGGDASRISEQLKGHTDR